MGHTLDKVVILTDFTKIQLRYKASMELEGKKDGREQYPLYFRVLLGIHEL